MGLSVQAVLQEHFEGFEQRHRLPRFRRNAARALALCKTAALGRHVRRCPHGHVEGVWYNSCRHRSCPQCGYLDIERWLDRRLPWLLPCRHYHLVFTLPGELNELWTLNTKLLTELLFDTVHWALSQMLNDPRRLGVRPGVLAALHTWGRTLCLHPHLHCLLTAGGADRDQKWRNPRRDVLLPCRPLGELFRGRFLRRLQLLERIGKLRLPPDYQSLDFVWLLRRCARRKWTPFVSEPYLHAKGVLLYLARYVRGGPFRNSSLVHADHSNVSFRFSNWRRRDERGKPTPDILTLPVADFLYRLLSHVPKPHTRTVRGWGLYAHTQRPLAELCRLQLADLGIPDEAIADLPQRTPQKHPLYCPQCRCRLVVQQLDRCGRSPPLLEAPA